MRNPACSEATTEHRLHWAFSTLGCPDLDLAEAACLAAQYGLDGIEARVVKGRLDLPILFDQTYGTPEAFAAAVRVHHVARGVDELIRRSITCAR